MRITLSLAPSLFTQHRTLRTEGERGKEQEENKANTNTFIQFKCQLNQTQIHQWERERETENTLTGELFSAGFHLLTTESLIMTTMILWQYCRWWWCGAHFTRRKRGRKPDTAQTTQCKQCSEIAFSLSLSGYLFSLIRAVSKTPLFSQYCGLFTNTQANWIN